MRIFVLGLTHSGKSPLCQRISTITGWPVYSTSGYARSSSETQFLTLRGYVKDITERTVAMLRDHPAVGLEYILKEIDPRNPAVIDGERNPFDFIHLFSPGTDVAVSLTNLSNTVVATEFDRGIEVILGYLDWLHSLGLVTDDQHQRVEFHRLYNRERRSSEERCLESELDTLAKSIVDISMAINPAVQSGTNP